MAEEVTIQRHYFTAIASKVTYGAPCLETDTWPFADHIQILNRTWTLIVAPAAILIVQIEIVKKVWVTARKSTISVLIFRNKSEPRPHVDNLKS